MEKFRFLLIGSALITGAANTLGFTLQNKQPVIENNIHKHFFHPFMQVAIRFVSNFCTLPLHFALQRRERDRQSHQSLQAENEVEKENQLPKPHLLLYMIPTLLDYVAVVCYYIALNFISGSVYQILRGGTVLTTFLFSYTCLNIRPTRSRIAGCLLVLLGLVIVGLVNFFMSSGSSEQKQETLIGYALILVGLFGNGLHFVYEEHLITKYQAKPLFIVGIEGLFGTVISLVLIPLLAMVPCSFGQQDCVMNDSGDAVMQNAAIYFKEVWSNELILVGVILVFASMPTYNSVGVTIAKYMSSLTRAICDVSRTVIVWVVGIIITVVLGEEDKRFQWQSLSLWQILGESAGFLILILGNLVYYDIIKLQPTNAESHGKSTLIEEQSSPYISAES